MLSIFILFGVFNCLLQKVHGITNTVNVRFSYKSDGVLPCSGVVNATFYANNVAIKPDGSKYAFDSSANSLTVKTIKSDDAKKSYYCSNSIGDRINFALQVPPYLYQVDSLSISTIEGYYADIECFLLVGTQNSQTISWNWFFNDQPISGDSRFSVSNYADSTKLIIKNTKLTDKGNFKCSADNNYGSHSRITYLRVKSYIAPLWPFLGLLFEIALLAGITLYYEISIKGNNPFKKFKTAPIESSNNTDNLDDNHNKEK